MHLRMIKALNLRSTTPTKDSSNSSKNSALSAKAKTFTPRQLPKPAEPYAKYHSFAPQTKSLEKFNMSKVINPHTRQYVHLPEPYVNTLNQIAILDAGLTEHPYFLKKHHANLLRKIIASETTALHQDFVAALHDNIILELNNSGENFSNTRVAAMIMNALHYYSHNRQDLRDHYTPHIRTYLNLLFTPYERSYTHQTEATALERHYEHLFAPISIGQLTHSFKSIALRP